MFKCLECGALFDECETRRWKEPHGEEMMGCPCCGGTYKETKRCKICSGEFLEDELYESVCEECIEDYRRDFETCYKVLDNEKKSIEINYLLASVLDITEIETILYLYIKDNKPDVDLMPYINEDKYSFAKGLLREVIGDENSKN